MENNWLRKEIPIVFATNEKYCPYMATAIQSIIEHSSMNYQYSIFVLYDSISEYNMEKIVQLHTENVSIEFVDVSNLLNEIDVELHSHWHYSKEMYYRFLITRLFKQYSKVIYLDSDLVVEEDISRLYEIDINDYLIAACWNISRLSLEERLNNDLGITRKEYFNSGVLLINTNQWQTENIEEKCFDLLKEIPKEKLKCPDQDILNIVCRNRVLHLDDTWNFQWNQVYGDKEVTDLFKDKYHEKVDKASIIHFASGIKPWSAPELPLSHYFWKYARHTNFYEEIIYSNILTKVKNDTDILQNDLNKRIEAIKKDINKSLNKATVNKSEEKHVDNLIIKFKRKVKGGMQCYKEHGWSYTWRRTLEHFGIPMDIGLERSKGKNDNNLKKETTIKEIVNDKEKPILIKKDFAYFQELDPKYYAKELEEWYSEKMGWELNLSNPKRYTEKIQWMKLYDSSPLKTQLTDKYLVRQWITEKIGAKYLVPLLGVWDSFDEIDFDTLPEKFALKTTHSSGWNIIVKDKSSFNIEDAKRRVNIWLGRNYAYNWGLELHYKDIKPRIIAEQFIENAEDLYDYKVLCFHGEPKYIWVDSQRYTDHRRDFFDLEWNHLDVKQKHKTSDKPIVKPTTLKEMIEVAKVLSQGFSHVRVDFYEIEERLYFGEMTFTSASGVEIITPDSFDYELGSLFDVNKEIILASNSPDISIVIPVYNSAKYLHECLDSVIQQSYANIEVLCYDDASNDNSAEILAEYARKDSRIKVITYSENKSASQARKDGVMLAKGKYIMFLDSDDTLELNACAELKRLMDAYDVDVLQFGTFVDAENTVREEAIKNFETFVAPYIGRLNGRKVFDKCFVERKYRFNVWNKIYKSAVCKKAFSYVEDGFYPKAQDLYAYFSIAWCAESYCGIENRFYHYNYGRGITGGGRELSLEGFERQCTQANVATKCKLFLEKQGVFNDYEEMWEKINRDLLNECLANWLRNMNDENGSKGFDIIAKYWSVDMIIRAINVNFKNSKKVMSQKASGAKILQGKELVELL